MKILVRKSVMVSNIFTTVYAGVALLFLSFLLDVTITYKLLLVGVGSITLLQAHRLKSKYERDKTYGWLPLLTPSTILTILGVYFLILSILFMGKNNALPPSLLMAIQIIAGLSVVGLASFVISICYIGISGKQTK